MNDFGQTAIRVYFEHMNDKGAWEYCGPVFSGKPFNIAYSASDDLATFILEKNIKYVDKEFLIRGLPANVSDDVLKAVKGCSVTYCIYASDIDSISSFVTEEMYNNGTLEEEELTRIEDEFTFQYINGYMSFYMPDFVDTSDVDSFRVIIGFEFGPSYR